MRLFACLLIGLLTSLSMTAEAGFRCDGKIVKRGDRMFEVRELCGEPDVVVPLHSVYTIRYGHVPTREEWQYNLGPHRLMRFLRFQDGRLTRVRTGRHGFRPGNGACSPGQIESGITQMELLSKCGKPREKELRITGVHYRTERDGRVYRAGMPAEDWIYDFGPRRFIRIVTLINGRVVNIETSSRRGSRSAS